MQLAILGNQQLTMGTRQIAEMLGKNHSDIKRSAERLHESGVIGGSQPLAESPFINEQGREFMEYRLGKLDSITLVAQNSPQFTAALVKRWDELEGKAAAAKQISDVSIADVAGFAEIAGRALNMSNSSRLGMFQKIQSDFGLPNILPAYAIDAPSDAVDGSSRPTKALTAILKDSGHAISAKFAYQALQQLWIVERMSRKSTKGEKEFWALTAKGLLYGKNITSPNNQREVQPHFYESRSADLVKMIFDQALAANDNGGAA